MEKSCVEGSYLLEVMNSMQGKQAMGLTRILRLEVTWALILERRLRAIPFCELRWLVAYHISLGRDSRNMRDSPTRRWIYISKRFAYWVEGWWDRMGWCARYDNARSPGTVSNVTKGVVVGIVNGNICIHGWRDEWWVVMFLIDLHCVSQWGVTEQLW